MVASYKKSGQSGGSYYTNCMTATGEKAVDDYYSGSAKEPPGTWYVGPNENGSRSSGLGIKNGQVFGSAESREDVDRFSLLVQGFNPEGGKNLVQNAGATTRIALHDFTLSAPKSVSVIWSQADDKTKTAIEKAQERGAQAHLDFMSQKSYSRQGKDGLTKSRAALRGALFAHGSSREDDPQLHTHAVILNVCERADGTTGALETLEMMRWAGAAASLYHAELAYSLREIGFETERVGNLFEVSGVPADVREAFSQRREQILAAVQAEMDEKGLKGNASDVSRGLLQKATLETRSEKNELTREELEILWKDRGQALGFTEKEVLDMMNDEPVIRLTQEGLLEEARQAVKELTENECVFSESKLLTAVAVHLVGQATPEQILAATRAVIEKDLLKSTMMQRGEEVEIFTTRETVAMERRMLQLANRRDLKHVLVKIDLPAGLKLQQVEAAMRACTDPNAVTVIEGAAGAGKTFTMKSVSKQYEANGYTVTGLSLSWAAALNLKKETRLKIGKAIEGWLNKLEKGEVQLNSKSLVVVDEAGMVSAHHMKRILFHAERAGAKVVLLGDTLQQKSVAAGDPLRVITNQNGSTRLDQIVRQAREVDRAAVHSFFAGQAAEGLKSYLERGAVQILADEDKTHAAMITDWQTSRLTHQGESHLMLAVDKTSVNALNLLAHQARKNAGELGASAIYSTMDCKLEERIEFSVGDDVCVRANVVNMELYNRMQGQIMAIEGSTLKVLIDGKNVSVDTQDEKWQHRDGGLALQHAYATTTYASQSLTVQHVFVKDSLSLNRASAGVAMSRHKEECTLYVDRNARWEDKMMREMADKWHPVSQFSDKECMDRLFKSWTAEAEKKSTLDFDNWQKDKALVRPEIDVKILTVQDARKEATSAIERLRQASKLGGIKAYDTLPYQKNEGFELPEPRTVDQEFFRRGIEGLVVRQISVDVLRDAEKQGFLKFGAGGQPVFCGRRPEDNSLVLALSDKNPEPEPMRERFPPILHGNPDCVDIVKTPEEALILWNMQDLEERQRSTVIVSSGRDEALGLAHTQKIIEEAKTVRRYDVPASEDKLYRNTQGVEKSDAEKHQNAHGTNLNEVNENVAQQVGQARLIQEQEEQEQQRSM